MLVALAGLILSPSLPWLIDFEDGPGPFVGEGVQVVADPLDASNQCLRIGPNASVTAEGLELPAEFALRLRALMAEDHGWMETPVLLLDPEGHGLQAFIEGRSASLRVVPVTPQGYGPTVANLTLPMRIRLGEWHEMDVVRADGRLGLGVDGQPIGFMEDTLGADLRLGLRVGGAVTLYDDLAVTDPGDRMAVYARALAKPGGDPVLRRARRGEAMMEVPDSARPFEAIPLKVSRPARATLYAADGRLLAAVDVAPGEKPHGLVAGGPPGQMRLRVEPEGEAVWETSIALTPELRLDTDEGHGELFQALCEQVRRDGSSMWFGNRRIWASPTWFRDHVHEMKAYKWWAEDLTSYAETLFDLQPRRGFFHEIITNPGDGHTTFVTPEFLHISPEDDLAFIRLEIEADIEYLMVEAAHTIWQATGDEEWLRRALPHLEAGMRYCLEDPTRWDPDHGLMKRPLTPDTWDFVYGYSDSVRSIEPGMPMAIMHGDNSGLYQACNQLGDLCDALGDRSRGAVWRDRGRQIRARANSILWAGRHYIHQLYLQPVDTGVDESQILSLSNTYDINRGMPTHRMAVAIIDRYRELRESQDFAEWYALEPPYPQFGPYPAGSYINGGVAGFVAGELAKAAFNHGREEYGADVLRRVAELVERDGFLGFLYRRDGTDQGGGPAGWSAAAVLSAMAEGLAGITDEATLYEEVRVSPRFAAAGVSEADVVLTYGPSDAYVAMRYRCEPDALSIELTGSPSVIEVRPLLPSGMVCENVTVDGDEVPFECTQVEESRYVSFGVPTAGAITRVRVGLAPGTEARQTQRS